MNNNYRTYKKNHVSPIRMPNNYNISKPGYKLRNSSELHRNIFS